jgi:signal transduction histidine kinase
MKQTKVTFLFFLLLFFLWSCEKKIDKNIDFSKKIELKKLRQKLISKDFNFNEKLNFGKEILTYKPLEDSISYFTLNSVSYFFSKLNTLDSAIYYSKKMLALNITKNNSDYLGEVNYKLGGYFNKKNLTDSAFYYYNKSKEHYLTVKDTLRLSSCLYNISVIESDYGNYSASDSTMVEALKYIGKKRLQIAASAYNCLAINSKKRFLYQAAIYYYEKALEISVNKSSKIKFKNNIANVYKEQKNYTKAISILEDLLKDSIKNKKTKIRVIDNLAHIKWLQDSTKNVLKELLYVKTIREEEKDNYGLIASYSHLSDYFYRNDETNSLFYAYKMFETSKEAKSPQDQIEAIDQIALLETPQKAIKYYKVSIHLRDSLKEADIKRVYKFAKIKYNYDEEEKQKLKFKTLAIENELIAEQENNQKKNILISSILLISGLLFLAYRRKQQHKKRILQENYNTETRIAKRLHDELGNGIYNAITKVLNPKFNTEEIVNDLDKIYLQTRAISHENDSVETGENFDAYFRGLVTSYNSAACKIMLKDLSVIGLNTLDKEKQIVIYRVFNELFVNMKKHSNASSVVLSGKKTLNHLEMKYMDNGVGFKENAIIFKTGLKNMETRIKSINGTIKFENKSDKGIQVTIYFKK